MKGSKQKEIQEKLQEYFRGFFDEKAAEYGFTPIANWNNSVSTALQGNTVYPAADILITGREVSDPFTTTYNCQLGVYFADSLGQNGEDVINGWGDIIEAAFRNDHTLGGSCVHCDEVVTIECPRFDNGLWFAGVQNFSIEVTTGPYVYQEA